MIALCLLAVLGGESILKDCNGSRLYAMNHNKIWEVSEQETKAIGLETDKYSKVIFVNKNTIIKMKSENLK